MWKALAAFVSVLALFYLAAAFIAWDFDPANWLIIVRAMVAVFGGFVAVLAASILWEFKG